MIYNGGKGRAREVEGAMRLFFRCFPSSEGGRRIPPFFYKSPVFSLSLSPLSLTHVLADRVANYIPGDLVSSKRTRPEQL